MTASKALTRRRAAVKAVAESVPTAYVESPIQTVLATIQSVIGTELAYIRQRQEQSERPMAPAEAKKLANLVQALEKSVNVGRELTAKELGGLSDAELEAELVAELERLRAKK